ncbi:type VI secretion system Vgr family protein [Novosphingobium sp.]|uniref:type VI secretion system Vgr family protein n=1 Tax=Novosphingobium sp. TaxID=1874826 RepID=UPI003B528426
MADLSDQLAAGGQRDSRLTVSIDGEQLTLAGLEASEGLSQPFVFSVDLLSTLGEFDLLPHLGKPALVEGLRDGAHMRYFHGIITDGHMIGEATTGTHSWRGQSYHYRLTLQPRAFFHSQSSDFRIFQDMTVLDIVKDVLGRTKITYDVKVQSDSGANRVMKYCVQFGESDFAFVCRLLEEHGMYYFYRHDQSDHVLVICSSSNSHEMCTISSLEFNAFGGSMGNAGSLQRDGNANYVSDWQEFLSSGAQAKATARDYDFQTPSQRHEVSYSDNAAHVDDAIEIYTWPGRYYTDDEGKKLSTYQLESRRAQRVRFDGSTGCTALQTGQKFNLAKHPVNRFNGEYLVIAAHSSLASETYRSSTGGGSTDTHFTVIPASTKFRAPQTTPRPVARGPETAVVVGPAGEEIYVDKYGRVKVQFHWDRIGQKNEKSSCWIRVSQTGGLGNIVIPRIGHEVLVDFINGNPDRPIVVGRVFNAAQMPIYGLPDNKTRALWRSKTYKQDTGSQLPDSVALDTGAPGANEIRFEDKTGAEEFFVHAERDFNSRVRHNETHKVGKDVDIYVGKNRNEEVGENEVIKIGKNRTETVEQDESITIKGSRVETVKINETVNVSGDRKVTISGKDNLTVSGDLTVQVDGKISMTANAKITLQCGQSMVEITPSGVTISTVQLDVSGSATAQMSGAMTTVQASGVLTAQGTMVKINC